MYRVRRGVWLLFLYLVLTAGAAIMLLPFIWMLSTSLKDLGEALRMPPVWVPKEPKWDNYIAAWNSAPFGRHFFNSFFIATTTTVGEVITTIFAAYAFAKMKFFGKNFLFTLLLGTLMIPGQMLLVPNYVTITDLLQFSKDKAAEMPLPWEAGPKNHQVVVPIK